jgi:phosphate/sulfate permease
MNTFSFFRRRVAFLLVAALFFLLRTGAQACAFCNADATGSKMSKAADAGIIAMVFIMFGMLSAIGGFIWHLARRAKDPLPDYDALLSEEGGAGATPTETP